MTIKEQAAKAQRFNKATAVAVITVLAFVSSTLGFDIPAEVQGALATVAVFLVPNR